jgi:hypothetical protein
VTDERRRELLLSPLHGRIQFIVGEWFRAKYTVSLDDQHELLEAVVLLHGSPHAFRVPKRFSKVGDEPGTSWVALPVSVQPEEIATDWIVGSLESLSPQALDNLRADAERVANHIRSICYSIMVISNGGTGEHFEMAETILADLQTAAKELCSHDPAQTRNSSWHVSQAVEKCMKLFLKAKGQTPPHTHDLRTLADLCECCGANAIDRGHLLAVPSGKAAADLRYGGDWSVALAISAYQHAIGLIDDLAQQATPDLEFDARNLRLLLKPSWFEFEVGEFTDFLRKRYTKPNRCD